MKFHNYYVYIITNPGKSVLYIGVTNDLYNRLEQHRLSKGNPKTFAGRYFCYKLLYFEQYKYVNDAIEREKELKLMGKEDKWTLIKAHNPSMNFLKVVD